MKKITYILASLSLVLTGCLKTEKIDAPVDAVTIIEAYCADDTKSTLDLSNYHVDWSIGDVIKINGKCSAPLDEKDIEGRSAKFTFQGLLEAPYYGVYNGESCGEFVEGDAYCIMNLESPETYVEDSFDPKFATYWGRNQETPIVQFNHAMAYVEITPTEGSAPDATISYIKLTSRSRTEKLSGRFTLSFENGSLTPVEGNDGNKDYVVMSAQAGGVALGKPFIIAIPAQEYTQGISVRLVSSDGQYMERNLKGFTAEAGNIYPIATDYNPTGKTLVATACEVSSSTACFSWTLGKGAATDVALPWTIQCSASKDFAVKTEYTIPEGSGSSVWDNKTPKFCFGGLEQATTYYFRVKSGEDGLWSEVVSATTATYDKTVVTENAQEGDVILAEDFAASAVQAEIPTMSAGVSETGTSFTKRTGSFTVAKNDASYLPDALKNWGFARRSGGANLYANQGHIKLGTGSAQSYLVTPELSAIPAGNKATVEVTLTVAVYPDSNNDLKNVKQAIVSVEKGELNASNNLFTLSTTALAHSTTFDLAADNSKWTTYTVRLSNVESTNRLMIGSPADAGNNRLLVSDVKVKVISYDSNKVSDISLVKADRTSATIRWENISSSIGTASTYCLNVYKDEACTQPVYNQDVITYDVPFSRYSPFGTSKYIGQKNGNAIAPTELKVACGLLEPNTDYWFRVKPIEGTITVEGKKTKTNDDNSSTFSNTAAGAEWSDPFHFKTAPEHVAVTNEVIYTGFDALSIGPNMETMNAGVAPQFDLEATSSPQKDARMAFLTNFAAGKYNYGWCTWAPDRCNVAESNKNPCPFGSVVAWWGFCVSDNNELYLDGTNTIFTLNGSTKRYNRIGAVGDIKDWYLTSQVFPHMGMAFMNNTGNYIGTPNLTANLSSTPATCTVRVKAAKIANDGNANDVTIKAYKYSKTENKLNTTEVATITIPGNSCYKSYTDATNYTTDFTTKDYTCEVSLASGDAIVLAVSSFAIIDEIQIVKK